MLDMIKDLLTELFAGGVDKVPPPPQLIPKKKKRTTEIDDRQANRIGQIFDEVKPPDEPTPEVMTTGMVSEWRDASECAAVEPDRNPMFTRYDKQVLLESEFATIDVTKYKILKKVWADGISNAKADDDQRVQKLDKFGETTRKKYYKAMGISHDLEVAALSKKSELAPTPVR